MSTILTQSKSRYFMKFSFMRMLIASTTEGKSFFEDSAAQPTRFSTALCLNQVESRSNSVYSTSSGLLKCIPTGYLGGSFFSVFISTFFVDSVMISTGPIESEEDSNSSNLTGFGCFLYSCCN